MLVGPDFGQRVFRVRVNDDSWLGSFFAHGGCRRCCCCVHIRLILCLGHLDHWLRQNCVHVGVGLRVYRHRMLLDLRLTCDLLGLMCIRQQLRLLQYICEYLRFWRRCRWVYLCVREERKTTKNEKIFWIMSVHVGNIRKILRMRI